uniref:EGF-like domain-containing protein n=2 Tax=Schistosoma mansoni TaxID=6183 RepID=A0A5K4F6D7_SCHMA
MILYQRIPTNLIIILIHTVLAHGSFEQSTKLCENNSSSCVNGHCINGTCVCITCWMGKTCEERVHRIPKFTHTVFTFETKFSNWINGNLIGSLSLSDENSSLASCGSVQFNIVPGLTYLPVSIDGTTGTLKVIDSDYGTIKNNHNITFQVTVRNTNTSLNISDDATVNILIDGKYSEEETESEITAVKRGFIVPPNTTRVTFSRVYIQDNPNYCLFDTWFIDSVIVLPPGNQSLIMNFSGPSLNNVYYGYIQYLFAYYNGTNIANNYSVNFNNLTYLNNNSSPSVFTMTSQICVSSAPANDSNDFSIMMRFKVGLFSGVSIPPIGTNLTIKMEALLTPKITADISMIVSSNCPIQYDSVNFTKCPQQVEIGGIYEYSVNYFISRPIGDYVFTFTTDEYSASIGHISLTLPTTFSTYPEGYKIDTQQLVGSNFVLTTIGYVSVSNLQNPALKDTSIVNEVEKWQFFNVQLSIMPYTRAAYGIQIFTYIAGKFLVEPCSVDYLLTENNSTKKIRLITEYSVYQGRRATGTTLIGIFRNNNPWNVSYNFQIGVNLFNYPSYVLGDTVQFPIRMYSGTLTISTFVVTLPITSMVKPISTTPVPKTPVVTIEKVEPRSSQPAVNFSTVVEVRVKFVKDFVYIPVIFQLQVNSSEAIIIRQSIQTIGYLLKTVAPVGSDLSVKPNLARLQINSVYFNESCTDAQCDIALRYSIIPITTQPLVITSTLTSGVSSFTKTLTITPRANYSAVLSSSQAPGVALTSINSKTVKNQVIPNTQTTLKLTLTLKPNVWQTIHFQLYAPGAYQEYILVRPIILSQLTSLTYISINSYSLENMVYLSIDKAYYEVIGIDMITNNLSFINKRFHS